MPMGTSECTSVCAFRGGNPGIGGGGTPTFSCPNNPHDALIILRKVVPSFPSGPLCGPILGDF